MAISKEQAMRPALNDVINAVNQIGDIEPYITAEVDAWLDEHPEATTTVEDGSITFIKLATSLAEWLVSEYDKRPTYDSVAPLFTSGAALALIGSNGITETWLERVSSNTGSVTIQSIHGNSIVQDESLVSVNMTGIESTAADESWTQTRPIPAGTLRGAGSVYDELTATERITRVGVVDLGALTWMRVEITYTGGSFYAFQTTSFTAPFMAGVTNFTCAIYDCTGTNRFTLQTADNTMAPANTTTTNTFLIRNDSYTDAAAFKTAMDGVLLFYALATPTVTPIDPPLNMTYRTEQGGTERVMVPTGENSAPPTLVMAQGYTAESLLDTIAPIEGNTASANYAVDSYLIHDGKLCLVVSSIAIGETIVIGQNVTVTTVMAELVRLAQ